MEVSPILLKFAHFIQHLNIISLVIFIILVFMSVLSWYLIIAKALQLGLAYWRSQRLLKLFWHVSSLKPVITYLSQTKSTNDPFSHLALQGIKAAIYSKKRAEKQLVTICSHSEFITRNLRRAINEDTVRLNAGLTLLANIGSAAPFIGLLGTVLGIYDAFVIFSARENAALNTVAVLVGEALIMTALGLAVALPAVLGYNILMRSNNAFLNQLEDFASDLHACLNTGTRITR
ncbi:MAG: MotA/TolQ/ExbB proton channel family protein [Candidatus Parabeggiatoa sp. nov. 1]|nr:MAG: MotA/TolQ/ExbB proton channel family protein [Gammaproteobacteria bacterium]